MPKPPIWTDHKIFIAIKHRIRYKKPLTSRIVFYDNMALWKAGYRKFGSWGLTLKAFFEAYPEFKNEEIYALEATNFKLKTGRKRTRRKKQDQLKLPLKESIV